MTAIAWLMAIAVGYLIWRHADWLRSCGPLGLAVAGWRSELDATYALFVPDVLLPAAATLCIRRHPGVAAVLAAIQILLMPVAFEVLARWNALTS